MKGLIALLTLSFVFASFPLTSQEVAASSLSTWGKGPGPCVKYMGSRPYQGNSRYALRFFSSCPDKVLINVCVTYDDGSSKFYPSARRVPVAGSMEIYTEPWKRPVDVNFTFGYYAAEIPPPCKAVSLVNPSS
ncbi:hypothetical protein [Estrella lausannensis]|uniref:Secreted protein n=1 Tax=Estrella lausannensis TaxID=483423 RepID=A0A0H5DP13_9BACT|nr:hypothetical protein [Estrella lausannensis]CRX38211.1 Conserved hypothetical protein [Estrella lausannensis]